MAELDDSYDLALAAASLRASSGDLHVLLRSLSELLSDALGDRLQVERAGGRFRKSDTIASVRVVLSGDQFDAIVDGTTVRCSVGHFSGGIKIRSESLSMEDWLVRLLGELKNEAAHNSAAQQALENIVIGGH